MKEAFDLSKFDEYREDNRREVKKANGGLPNSLWDTYSSFANCYGGVIILGIKEEKDGSWRTTGLQNEAKLRKDFWDTINNPKKVNLNLLTDEDVVTCTVDPNHDVIMVIYVPMAKREQKPIYINNDIFNGTFRRNYEGDYHCTRLQVKAMLRDQTERTMDMEILDKVPMEDLNYDTIHGYRNSHRTLKEGHPFERLSDHEYLRSIGAAARKEADKITFANPGYVRTGKKQMRLGGESDPRNKSLMKMFNLINIGERAGSGVPNIFNVWNDEGFVDPEIEERFNPDRTVLTLPFVRKTIEKSDGKKRRKKSDEKKTRAI